MKNVIEYLNQLNYRGAETSAILGILFSFNRTSIISFNPFDPKHRQVPTFQFKLLFIVPTKGVKNAQLHFLGLSRPVGNFRYKFSKKHGKKLKTCMLQLNII